MSTELLQMLALVIFLGLCRLYVLWQTRCCGDLLTEYRRRAK